MSTSRHSTRFCGNGQDHYHVSKGSMKLSHNLDDRYERSLLKGDVEPTHTPITASQSQRILSNVEKLRAALRQREGK